MIVGLRFYQLFRYKYVILVPNYYVPLRGFILLFHVLFSYLHNSGTVFITNIVLYIVCVVAETCWKSRSVFFFGFADIFSQIKLQLLFAMLLIHCIGHYANSHTDAPLLTQ